MKKNCLFLLLCILSITVFARKPAKNNGRKHQISQKHPQTVVNQAATTSNWAADFVWQINEGEKQLIFQTRPSHDKELKYMVKYLFQSLKKDTSDINFTFIESEVEKPLAALQTDQRFVIYNPKKLNVDLYGPHIAGIVYQIGHHILLHTAKMDEKKAILAADSFYGHCVVASPSLVASGHGRKLLDSLPETPFKKQRILAFQKGTLAGKESVKEKISEEKKKWIAQAKARAAKQKRFYVFVFLTMLATLMGVGYWFRLKH